LVFKKNIVYSTYTLWWHTERRRKTTEWKTGEWSW